MRWTSEGLMVCACDTSGQDGMRLLLSLMAMSRHLYSCVLFLAHPHTHTPTGERVTLASSFFFVFFFGNMETISFPPHKGRRRPESVGGERVVSFDIGPPPRMNVGGYMPRYTSTTIFRTIQMYHSIGYYYAVLYLLTRVVPRWANTFTTG